MNRSLRTILLMAWAAIILMACSGEPLATLTDADGLDPAAIELAASAGRPIADRYVVVFHDGVGNPNGLTDALVRGTGGTVHYRYETTLKGFAATLPAAAVEGIRRNPNVAYVEQDTVMTIVATTQSNATWGLDRIDQRALPLSTTYGYDATGAGVRAYVIDTGIHYGHSEFGGRATFGYDAFGGSGSDCNGHGTHVAGTVGGAVYGVAKGVSLVAVRVLDCGGSGTTSGVIAGVEWVTANHTKPAVANMSLGGGASTSLDQAVNASISAGITYAVAAGNGDFLGRQANACNYSPARVAAAITIGATTNTDAKTSWSNYGDCVDWFAPGLSITSAWHTGNSDTKTISGTSMAAPHVAGAAALYLQSHQAARPSDVRDALYDATTKGIVTSSSTKNNHLLYSEASGTTTPATNSPPTASFTYGCIGLTCTFTDTSTDDGEIASWAWTFADMASSTLQHPTYTYASAGDYRVELTVSDNAGATHSTSTTVNVTAPSTEGIALTVRGYKVKGVQRADLAWSGAGGASVDVIRDGGKITTTTSDTYTDNLNKKGGGSYTYRVCHAGTTTCSNSVTVTF